MPVIQEQEIENIEGTFLNIESKDHYLILDDHLKAFGINNQHNGEEILLRNKRTPSEEGNKEELELILSNYDFKSILEATLQPTAASERELLNTDPFYPDDFTLAQFAYLTYQDDVGINDLPQGWQLLTTAKNEKDGYFGSIYWHAKQQQIVVAHRGTKPNNPGSLEADMQGIIRCRFTDQMTSAAALAQLVIKVYEELKTDPSISFTGHSLGGWLSQVSSYFVESKGYHPHTVVFDSPGAKSILERMQPNLGNGISLGDLDITTYVSAPNIINTCHQHIGAVYQIYPQLKETSGKFEFKNIYKFVKYTAESHAMKAILGVFDDKTKKAREVKEVQDWPSINWLAKESEVGLFTATKNSLAFFLDMAARPVVKALQLTGLTTKSRKVKSTWRNIKNTPGIISDFLFQIDKEQYQHYCKLVDITDQREFSFSEVFSLRFKAHYQTRPAEPNRVKLNYFSKKEIIFLESYQLLRDHTDISHFEKLPQFLTEKGLTQTKQMLASFKLEPGKKWVDYNEDAPWGIEVFKHYVKQLLHYWPEVAELVVKEVKSILPTLQKNSKEHNEWLASIEKRLTLVQQQASLSSHQRQLPEIWHVPPQNPHFTGRTGLLDQITLQLQQENVPVILTAIHGLGGIGKTQTALEFVHRNANYKQYKGVLWFNAENKDRLQQDYIELGNELHILYGYEKVSIEERARHVKQWLEDPQHAGWLLVYDNAPEYGGDNGIGSLIPTKQGKVIITSRQKTGWPEAGIEVKIFTPGEAKNYIEKVLAKPLSDQDSSKIDELAQTLGHLPLALAQAAANIKKNKLSIARYLELYKTKKQTVLSNKALSKKTLPPDSDRMIVYVTWDITMDKIYEESPLAANWLINCAYLASNDIPDFLLEKFSNDKINNPNDEIYEEARGILSSYSMLNIDEAKHSASIHNLLQEVIQLKLKVLGTAEEVIKTAYHLLKESFPYGSKKQEDYLTKQQLLPQAEAFLLHINQWLKEKSADKSGIEKDYLEGLLTRMSDGYDDLGDYQRAKALLEQALSIVQRNYVDDHIEVAKALVNLGTAYSDLGDYQRAKALLEQALPIVKRYYGDNHVAVASTLTNLANTYGALGGYQEAKLLLEQALLVIEKQHYGNNHIEVASTLGNLANVYSSLGGYQEAKVLLEQALVIEKQHYGDNHIEVASTLGNLANVYGALGDYQKAKELLEQALVIARQHYGDNHIEVVKILVNLGTVYSSLGDYQKAKALLEQALPIVKRYYGDNHVAVASTLTNLGNIYSALEDYQGAKELLELALVIEKQHYANNHIEVAKILVNLGGTYSALEDYQKAKELLEQALVVEKQHYGDNHIEVAKILVNLGTVYNSLGDYQKAKELLEKALPIFERHNYPKLTGVRNLLNELSNLHRATSASFAPQRSVEALAVVETQVRQIGLTTISPSSEPATSGSGCKRDPVYRMKREIGGCIGTEEESSRFFPYEPLAATKAENPTSWHQAQCYIQLAMAVAWEHPELLVAGDRKNALDPLLVYATHRGDIIQEGAANHSPREQSVLVEHAAKAQQFFTDYPQTTLFNPVVQIPADSTTLTPQSWLFDNGRHSLLVLSEGSTYQLYSPDFNYRQRFQTRAGVTFAELEGFVQAFFRWRSGRDDYTRWMLRNPLPEGVIDRLRAAPFWTPEQIAPDRVLLSQEPAAFIEGIPIEAVRQLVHLDGQTPDLDALHPTLFKQYTGHIRFRVDLLHRVLPTLTDAQRQALVATVKRYDWPADTRSDESPVDVKSSLETYDRLVLHELKTASTISPERLSELSWQTLRQAFDQHPEHLDISSELKENALKNIQNIHTAASKTALAKGIAVQALFFLPDIIRSTNTGQVQPLVNMGGMLAADASLNHLYLGLVNRLEAVLPAGRAGLLRRLPVTSPIFKALTIYSIVELTKQLHTLPAHSAMRHTIQHQLGEQYVTVGLIVAELLGFEVTPLWIALIAEQLISAAIHFRRDNHLDIPFWEAFIMSLGFEQDTFQHIVQERQLVDLNLEVADRLNSLAAVSYDWILLKVPRLGEAKWYRIHEHQVPLDSKEKILQQQEPFSWFASEKETKELDGFRRIRQFEMRVVDQYAGEHGVLARGYLNSTYWERVYYAAYTHSNSIQFLPSTTSYQEDNIFLSDVATKQNTSYQRVASVEGDYPYKANLSPVKIQGPGLAALYATPPRKLVGSQVVPHNLYVGFDPREGDMQLNFPGDSLKGNITYHVTVQVGRKPYPDSLVFSPPGGLFSLKDSGQQVTSHYLIRLDNDDCPFRIRDEAVNTRVAFAAPAANRSVFDTLRSDGPEIIQIQRWGDDNVINTTFFNTLWLKGHKEYVQLVLNNQMIEESLIVSAKHVDIYGVQGRTPQSRIEVQSTVSTFTMGLLGNLNVKDPHAELCLIGKIPAQSTPVAVYSKTHGGPTASFYNLAIEDDLQPLFSTLSREGTSTTFSLSGLNGAWKPDMNTAAYTSLKISGQWQDQPAFLIRGGQTDTLNVFDQNQQLARVEVVHYTSQGIIEKGSVLKEVSKPSLLNTTSQPDQWEWDTMASVHRHGECWEFQSPQGYPVAHHFPISDTITLNNIDYQMQGKKLYAISGRNNSIDGDDLLRRYRSDGKTIATVSIHFSTALKESQLSLVQNKLTINGLTLYRVPDPTHLYFSEKEVFSIKTLQDTLAPDATSSHARHRRALESASPSECATSGGTSVSSWFQGSIALGKALLHTTRQFIQKRFLTQTSNTVQLATNNSIPTHSHQIYAAKIPNSSLEEGHPVYSNKSASFFKVKAKPTSYPRLLTDKTHNARGTSSLKTISYTPYDINGTLLLAAVLTGGKLFKPPVEPQPMSLELLDKSVQRALHRVF